MESGVEPIDTAWEHLARARAGVDVADTLAGDLDTLEALPYAPETWAQVYAVKRVIRLALFASAHREHVDRVIGDVASYLVGVGNGRPVLRGVILREGDPLGRSFPDNPWGIPADATLDAAVMQVWAPVTDRAPRFLAALRKRLVGLALADDHRGEPCLVYLRRHDLDAHTIAEDFRDRPRPARDRRHALAWEPYGDVTSFTGDRPDPEAQGRARTHVPEVLDVLYAIHSALYNGMWHLPQAPYLRLWSEMLSHDDRTAVNTEDPDEVVWSEDLLHFFSYGDDRNELFDLTGDSANPPVRAWGDGTLYARPERLVTFWDWFDDNTDLFLDPVDD
jgi:hypothetical protein